MYAYISGKLVELSIGKCIIDVNGIGYLINIAINTYASLKNHGIGSIVKLYQYLYVREDELSLFGFYTIEEKNLFLKFLQVEGIGPKKALEIFNYGTADEFVNAIESQDPNIFIKVKGIGQKQAQKIILELTGKLGDFNNIKTTKIQELFEGLQNLGFSKKEVENALNAINKDNKIKIDEIDYEQAFKIVLSQLSKYK